MVPMRDLLSEAGLLAWLGQVTVAGSQCPEDGCFFLERHGLGAYCRFDSGLLQSRAQGLLRVLQLQIVPQCLAFLTEREFEELNKFRFRDPQLFELRRHGEPHYRGMHFWRRRKGTWRKREQPLRLGI